MHSFIVYLIHLLTSSYQLIKNKWNTAAPITHQLSAVKSGHLYLRRRKALGNPWKRIYAHISPTGTFSYESLTRRGVIETAGEELNLMLCEIRPVEQGERRFCFEIYSGSQAMVLQAESEDDMMDWVNTFHTAKSGILVDRVENGAVEDDDSGVVEEAE